MIQIAATVCSVLALVGLWTRPAAALAALLGATCWQDPPLRRELLFDYAAGRDVPTATEP